MYPAALILSPYWQGDARRRAAAAAACGRQRTGRNPISTAQGRCDYIPQSPEAARQVAVKVSPEGDRLITSGSHYLHMSKKDLVEAAVEFYLNARREEIQAGLRELLSQLDGTRAARGAMLGDVRREELESVGGIDEDG